MELGSSYRSYRSYRREDAFDESREGACESLGQTADQPCELKAATLLRSATAEKSCDRPNDALRLLIEAAPLFAASRNHRLKGRFHNEYAEVLCQLGTSEKRADYTGSALSEYETASYHFELAGDARAQAQVENDLGLLLCTLKRFRQAHEHLDRAQALFTGVRAGARIAQVDETRARVLLAEGRLAEAEKLARCAVQALAKCAEQKLVAEALTTHGMTLARLGRDTQARRTLQCAVEVAEQAGAGERAGQAALTMVEELGERLTADELGAIYERALDLLAASRNQATKDRLLSCARYVLFQAGALPAPQNWENFSLKETLRRYEARIIERALKDADKSVTRASRMLGFRNHTSLIKKLNTWHEDLLSERAPARERRQSLMFINEAEASDARAVVILHVEDNRLVACAVSETLALEGWTVESLSDGALALNALRSEKPYDVLIFDQDLPGLCGLELVGHARQLEHRQQTPIIMLSGSDVEREARREGVTAFLRKPDEIALMTETIARLLARRPKQK